MKINHSIINILNIIFKKKSNSNYFRILNFHHIALQNFDKIKKNLIFLSKDHDFINPSDLALLKEKNFQFTKKTLLLTFDDGFFSQKKFAVEVLKELNIKAIFFVIPNFVSANDLEKSKYFIKNNILDSVNLHRFDNNMRNMQIDDLKYLIQNGHEIGMHSLNHARLSNIKNIKILEQEIFSNLDIMENLLGIKVKSFAYPYGDIKSINATALNIISKHYNYIFTGIRGDNNFNNQKIFWRDAIDDHFDINLCEGLLRGFSDFYYYNDRKKLKTMINK